MKKNNYNIKSLLLIMSRLRDPKKGCIWDKKQTLESIIPYSIEEVYEVAEQIYNKNYEKLKEELGDLLFQVVYLSQIAKEKGKFSFDDVVNQISKKMIYRHPHIFSNKKFINIKDFNNWWEKSKKKSLNSILDDIPTNLPALNKSYKIQKKVAGVGFDYPNVEEALNKVQEELNELKIEVKNKKNKKIKEELGDLFFAVIDLSRKQNYNPELILTKANKKFIKRFQYIEQQIIDEGKQINRTSIKYLEKLWKKSKKI